MSWEEEETSQTVCPCGNGRITQKHYSDGWGRFEDGPVVIECEDCNKKYKVKEEQHYGRLASDGSWSKYFLLPITSAVDLATVPPELVGSFNLIFFNNAEDAVYKALGVE